MHYFGNPRHTQSMIAYMMGMILTEFSGNSSENLHCGHVVNKPYTVETVVYAKSDKASS